MVTSLSIAVMNNPARLLLALLTLVALTTSRAQTPATKPGYSVTIEVSYDETGKPEDAKIVKSDDPTGDRTLEQIAMKMVEKDVQPAKVVDGKPVKFKARRPFNFPVAGDQGEAANVNRPVLRAGNQVLPKFPESMIAKNEIGGAIVELVIGADGVVRTTKVLASSHPEFAQEAQSALSQWTFVSRDGPGMPAESTWHVAVAFSLGDRKVDLKWRLAPRPAIGSFTVGRLPPAPPAAPAAPAVETPAEKK
jgi:outer membrane biosynthesis protein TonB